MSLEKIKEIVNKDKMLTASVGFMSLLALGNVAYFFDKDKTPEEPTVQSDELGFFGGLAQSLSEITKGWASNDTEPSVLLDLDLSDDEKIVVGKILYFETLNTGNPEADAELARPIVESMKNRYLFDACHEASPIENLGCNPFFGGENGLTGVVMYKMPRATVHQYSCIEDNPAWFTSDMDTNVVLNVGTGNERRLDQDRLQALIRVLEEELKDNHDSTNGAFWYQNPDYTDQQWEGDQGFVRYQSGCDSVKITSLDVPRGGDWTVDGEAECRVDYKYLLANTGVTLGQHVFYGLDIDTKETVHKDACKFVDGLYKAEGSSAKWCTFK
jgi:hypothetical protein